MKGQRKQKRRIYAGLFVLSKYLYLGLIMTEEQAIRKRLFSCIDECGETLKEVATATSTNYSYLSALRTKDNPEIKASLISTFCKKYKYSPIFILLNQGKKKQENSSQLDRIEDSLDNIITTLLDAVTSSKHQNRMTDLEKLMNEARKRKN